jgi:Na+-driven multidrug efflux pump
MNFLNFMGKSYIPFYINILSTSLHLLWAYIFIIIFNTGIEGAAIAFTITHLQNYIFLYIVIPY